jgi:ribosomal protein S18 acetylase RimI-like enzyme
MKMLNNTDLLYHHANFLALHRGRPERLTDLEIIHSDKIDFNIAFPLSEKAVVNVTREFKMYLPDWINPGSAFSINWQKQRKLCYMVLNQSVDDWKINERVKIKAVSTIAELEDFSLVQVKGFFETDESFNEWHSWLRARNFKNFNDRNQIFYVAYEDETPVGVSLCINYHGITGIYAVATLPAKRKQGISAAILKHAIESSIKEGITSFTLQVVANSNAHLFYEHLGFKNSFTCTIYNAHK